MKDGSALLAGACLVVLAAAMGCGNEFSSGNGGNGGAATTSHTGGTAGSGNTNPGGAGGSGATGLVGGTGASSPTGPGGVGGVGGPPPPPSEVACGTAGICVEQAMPICCVTFGGNAGGGGMGGIGPSYACVQHEAECQGVDHFVAACDGPEDCQNAVCCHPQATKRLACDPDCPQGEVACHDDDDCVAVPNAPYCCAMIADVARACRLVQCPEPG